MHTWKSRENFLEPVFSLSTTRAQCEAQVIRLAVSSFTRGAISLAISFKPAIEREKSESINKLPRKHPTMVDLTGHLLRKDINCLSN